MATKVLLPKMGATMETGKIVEWLKEEGEYVEEGEPLLEIMTDKINLEVESPVSGVLLKIIIQPDEEVKVHDLIAYIGEPGEEIPEETQSEQRRNEPNPIEEAQEAVAVPDGLMVPVIRYADQRGLVNLTEVCKQLTKRARENQLRPDEITGSTFTISNLGMYAVDAFTPIINQPESAILGVGRISEKAVGINGSLQVRPMMILCLSFDHRVIDGAPAAQFLTDLKDVLENPYKLLL